MKITYNFENSKGWEESFDYEVDVKDLRIALADIFNELYFKKDQKENLNKFLNDLDYDLVEAMGEHYEDCVKEYFREEAFDSNRDVNGDIESQYYDDIYSGL